VQVRTTVLCFPVADLHATLGFYRGVFELRDAQIQGDTIALELPNLSLFLMTKQSYESYTKKANRGALMPGASAPAVISCAVTTKADVDQALGKADTYGGAHAGPAAVDPASGGYVGYVTDPDGHLWELVCPGL
jgi:uncharacterized protein